MLENNLLFSFHLRPKTPSVSEIRCHAMEGSPLKPSQLTSLEYEARHLQTAGQVCACISDCQSKGETKKYI